MDSHKSEPDQDIISSDNLVSFEIKTDTSKTSQSKSSQRKRKSKNSVEHIVAYSSLSGIAVPSI